MNAGGVVGTLRDGGDTQTLLAVVEFVFFALTDGEATKTSFSCYLNCSLQAM